jgi:anti-sigma B factor antagonist
MDIRIFEATGNLLVKIRGRVVLDECDRLKATVYPLINQGITQVNLELSDVDFIDSAGLGALVGVKVWAKKYRCRLALLNPSRGVSDILMVSKLDSIFDIITGQDAEELVRALTNAQFERSPSGVASSPVSGTSHGSIPIMPAQYSPAPSRPVATDPKERIDQLCKDAVEFMRKGDYDSAASCYQEAIELNPEYLPAHNNLAIVYEKRPQWQDKAIAQWQKVLELSSNNNDQKHIDRAQKHLSNLQRLG